MAVARLAHAFPPLRSLPPFLFIEPSTVIVSDVTVRFVFVPTLLPMIDSESRTPVCMRRPAGRRSIIHGVALASFALFIASLCLVRPSHSPDECHCAARAGLEGLQSRGVDPDFARVREPGYRPSEAG